MALIGEGTVTVPELCKIFGQTQQALRRQFRILAEKGIIESQTGRSGGFRLSADPARIYLGELIALLETDMNIIPLLEPADDGTIQHPNSVYRFAAEHARRAFLLKFDNVTIEDLAQDPYTLAAFGIEYAYERRREQERAELKPRQG